MKKITREQLKSIIIKEKRLFEQASYESEKLLGQKCFDSILDGINTSVQTFAAGDDSLEEFASDFIYSEKEFLDSLVDDVELEATVSGLVEQKVQKILDENKEEILKRAKEEMGPSGEENIEVPQEEKAETEEIAS